MSELITAEFVLVVILIILVMREIVNIAIMSFNKSIINKIENRIKTLEDKVIK